MKNYFALIGFICIVLSCSFEIVSKAEEDHLAFPGAEGFGKFATGGREGRVLIVDNLEDHGPGSLRAAVEAEFPRMIVFNVSGSIELKSQLKINDGNVTIAGQSAPGDGICIKNYPLIVSASNVIIRYLRIRMGDEKAQQEDCISIVRQQNVIIDHCSFSWGTDEVATAYDNENFTMQWCIISESLNKSVHEKGEHGYGGIWGGKGASFHHNLMAHHKSRLPRFCGSRYHGQPKEEVVDFRNNVIYNWKINNSYGGELGNHNVVNNYYKAGPATDKSKRSRILNPSKPYGKFFVSGNILHGNGEVSADNWKGVHAENSDSYKSGSAFEVIPIPMQTAEEAFKYVLKDAGASFHRDEVDERIIKEVSEGSAHFGINAAGIIDSQHQVGGWPQLSDLEKITDKDSDGMEDGWEKSNGLDPNDGSDHASYNLSDQYTNIEVYLNSRISN